jgi:hypothetical protein
LDKNKRIWVMEEIILGRKTKKMGTNIKQSLRKVVDGNLTATVKVFMSY